jgi:Fe2+ or Zn2+ uptake regulation protein
MSQEAVYKILEDLGGLATTKEIRNMAKKKYPNLTLYLYVTNRLKKLEKKGVIKKIIDHKKELWKDRILWKIINNFE